MRRAARRDANESGLVSLARELGAQWEYAGPLDGWICFRGVWTPVEIKVPRGKYTPAQVDFFLRCEQSHSPHFTWRDSADVLACLGANIVAGKAG